MKILIVEDSAEKYGKIKSLLIGQGVHEEDISLKVNAADALLDLRNNRYDLLILDINLPKRNGDDQATRGAGLSILREINRNETIDPPKYVVGMTQYEDAYDEFGAEFSDQLFSLVLYSDTSDQWRSALIRKVEYIEAVLKSHNFSDGKTYGVDVAIICALEDVELSAIKKMNYNWQPLNLAHDETRYLAGEIETNKSTALSVISASATKMGMPAAAVLCSKIIHNFRPKIVIMVGICGGRSTKVNLGDIIVADPIWDWGSGKISSKENSVVFEPKPDQIPLDVDIRAKIHNLAQSAERLAKVRKSATGKRPPFELKVHIAPLVSGASVVADKQTFETLISQHRDIHGLEMEGYGIAAAAKGSARPRPLCIIAKAVCDFADKDKDDDYQEYCADVSAQFVQEFLSEIEFDG